MAIRNYSRKETHQTAVCSENMHFQCEGLCAPKVYATTRPCECACHVADPRTRGQMYADWSAKYLRGQS